ncbi:hypothetical protein ES707_16920 [subsurface metagenome]
MRLLCVGLHLLQNIGVLIGYIVLLAYVPVEVVQFEWLVPARFDGLVIAHPHGDLLLVLPVEEFVHLLFPAGGILTQQGRDNRYPIDIIRRLNAGKLRQGWHDIGEIP